MNTNNVSPSNQSQPQFQQDQYYDFHSHGVGYFNRIREVKPRNASPFWAVDIAVCVGKKADKQTTIVDCRVSGKEAQTLIMRCKQACDEKRSIFASFTIGDIYPESFTYGPNHQKAGQTGLTMKGRLLRIKSIHIDKELVYRHPKSDNASNREVTDAATEHVPPQSDNTDHSVPADVVAANHYSNQSQANANIGF
ncbi:hypothetical protein CUZ56_01379 [Saezia sanguinis]|uniref:DUF3577 domain-containing protein n=1 Tax=Saezia sanguinis TaxID=1965230 RepID=A0A433SFL7_9BURK|nr:DUF3577 domain-containing protein [Saezia sanguinis]RUS67434.1 hypothetical protein CUZ56_01379 [Saezia sanguinis]